MLNKLMLSDKDYEYLTKGIAMGVGLGMLVGVMVDEIILFFALGGVIGILRALIYSMTKNHKKKKELTFIKREKKGSRKLALTFIFLIIIGLF